MKIRVAAYFRTIFLTNLIVKIIANDKMGQQSRKKESQIFSNQESFNTMTRFKSVEVTQQSHFLTRKSWGKGLHSFPFFIHILRIFVSSLMIFLIFTRINSSFLGQNISMAKIWSKSMKHKVLKLESVYGRNWTEVYEIISFIEMFKRNDWPNRLNEVNYDNRSSLSLNRMHLSSSFG